MMRGSKRYLEDRIVFCANCDGNRMLMSCPAGLVCSACTSSNWMYLPSGIVPKFKDNLARAPNVSAVLPVVTDHMKEGLQQMGHVLMQKVAELSQPGLAPILGR